MIPIPSPSSNGVHRSPVPAPAPPPVPTRVIELAPVGLDDGEGLQDVSPLRILEVKGVGNYFTAHFELARAYYAIPFKAQGSFSTEYQLLGKHVVDNPRLRPLVRPIVFIPAFVWSDSSTVLLPVKQNTYGQLVLLKLRTLQRRFPGYRAFQVWENTAKQYTVKWVPLDALEREVIDRHIFPTLDEITEVLTADAIDSIDVLADANPAVRALLTGKEVD
jgi:hypothetical protein